MNVASLETFDLQMHGATVVGDVHTLDRRRRVVNFGAAVARLIDVSVRLHRVRTDVRCGHGVDRLRKRQFESVRSGLHFVNFKWDFASPDEPVERIRFAAARAPAAIRAADEHPTIRQSQG